VKKKGMFPKDSERRGKERKKESCPRIRKDEEKKERKKLPKDSERRGKERKSPSLPTLHHSNSPSINPSFHPIS
jgi:hypothetical protein